MSKEDNKPKSNGSAEMYFKDKQLEMEHEIRMFGTINNKMVNDIHSKISYLNSSIYFSAIEEKREELVKSINKRMGDLELIKEFRTDNPKTKKTDEQIIKAKHPKVPKEILKSIDFANEMLEELMPGGNIKIWLKTYGGSITDALSIIDMMDSCHAPIEIIATGHVMSAGIPILMSGTKGLRGATKNTVFMSHNSTTGAYGNQNDLLAEAALIERIDDMLKSIALKRTKIKSRQYDKMDLATPFYFGVEEALKMGIIDYIVEGEW